MGEALGIAIFVGAVLVTSDIGEGFKDRCRRREAQKARSERLRKAVEENNRRQEYKCRKMMIETWDEVNNLKAYRERRRQRQTVTIKGVFAEEAEE